MTNFGQVGGEARPVLTDDLLNYWWGADKIDVGSDEYAG